MKLMTIEQFRSRVKELLSEVTLAEWVMDGIDEVCDKAEKYDALMAAPEDGSDEEPEELKNFTAIIEVPNGTRMETIKMGVTVKNIDTATHIFVKESEKMGGTLSTVYGNEKDDDNGL